MKRKRVFLSYLAIGVVALLLRVLDLDRFVHTDEVNFWHPRSYAFLEAVLSGNGAATAISTHPGVTTMWLGSVGILLRRLLLAWGMLGEISFPTEMLLLRLPVVLVHTTAILAGYAMLRRLFSPLVAALAVLLWATSPFITAFSRFLHVDGLTGTFATLSLLAACCYWNQGAKQETGWLLLSGVMAALAALSKSPGLAVGPVVVGLAILYVSDDLRQGWRAFLPLVVWGFVAVATVVLVWPAVRAAPDKVYTLLRVGVEVEGGSRHVVPNYFLGHMDPTPGPLYYPVVLVMRSTPWTLAGVLLLPWAARFVVPRSAEERTGDEWDRVACMQFYRTLAVLVGFVIVFAVGLSPFPKKLDRYFVAAFPALNILAAVGLVGGATWLVQRFSHRLLVAGLAALVALVSIGNAAWFHPYGIAYYNQLFGGVRAGVQTFLVGEGEGLGEAAAWLNAQPDITGVTVTSTMEQSLQASLREGAQAVSEKGTGMDAATGYVVVYIRHMQRWERTGPPPPYNRFYHRVPPAHVVTIHGVDYVHIYQVPRPLAQVVEADFGEAIHLHSYEVDTSAVRSSGVLSLTVQWQARGAIAENYHLFVHVFNEQGERVSQIDVPPAGLHAPSTSWPLNRYLLWSHPVPLPADLPPGQYWLTLGLYRSQDFTRLPLRSAPPPPPDAPDDGENTLVLDVVFPPHLARSSPVFFVGLGNAPQGDAPTMQHGEDMLRW
jgi:4-amino-4-deoxy-L-arabinose transferase-like glycosyltransferase